MVSCWLTSNADLCLLTALSLCRFQIPGMGGREDWGRTEDELMRARGVVDEVLVCMGLAPAHYDENLRARVRGRCDGRVDGCMVGYTEQQSASKRLLCCSVDSQQAV